VNSPDSALTEIHDPEGKLLSKIQNIAGSQNLLPSADGDVLGLIQQSMDGYNYKTRKWEGPGRNLFSKNDSGTNVKTITLPYYSK